MTASEARKKLGKDDVRVFEWELGHSDRARAEGSTEGRIIAVTDSKFKVVGAHILAPAAGEMISQFTLAREPGAATDAGLRKPGAGVSDVLDEHFAAGSGGDIRAAAEAVPADVAAHQRAAIARLIGSVVVAQAAVFEPEDAMRELADAVVVRDDDYRLVQLLGLLAQ